MTFAADLSFGWPSLTGAVLRGIGVSHVVGYAGCDFTSKNVSKARFQDWLDNGLQVALVIENGERDMLGGAKAGAYLGQNLADAMTSLGYDGDCVGFTAADFNATSEQDYNALCIATEAFRTYVPVAGYYGDGDSIDRVCDAGHATYGWQSSSTSYSPGGVSKHARLLQYYNDPRACGLALDANDILSADLCFMGEPTPKEENTVTERIIVHANNVYRFGHGSFMIPIGPLYQADGKTQVVDTRNVLNLLFTMPECLTKNDGLYPTGAQAVAAGGIENVDDAHFGYYAAAVPASTTVGGVTQAQLDAAVTNATATVVGGLTVTSQIGAS